MARKVFAFGSGSMPPANDPEWATIQKKFADSHYNFLQLLRAIALSDLLYSVPERRVSLLDSK